MTSKNVCRGNSFWTGTTEMLMTVVLTVDLDNRDLDLAAILISVGLALASKPRFAMS